MLVLSRFVDEGVTIYVPPAEGPPGGSSVGSSGGPPAGRLIHITVVEIRRGNKVRLGIDADLDVRIWRDEIAPEDLGEGVVGVGPAA